MSEKKPVLYKVEVGGEIKPSGQLEAMTLSATASVTDAIVSVTSNSMRAELIAFSDRVERLDMPTHKLLAEGSVRPNDIEIKTTLRPELTKAIAAASYQDRELNDRREHEKALAKINASGATRAEVIKWLLGIVGAVILALVSWYLGKQSG